MFTPQQIEPVSVEKATFGGYKMEDVDAFLEPLTDDYVTLYKENALLKSKMKVRVGKLEEYRNNEASMKEAIVNAQKTCDMMVKDAEAKCTQMLNEANVTVAESVKNSDALIAAEEARVEDARKVAYAKIEEMQNQIRSCLNALERIKETNRPTGAAPFDYDMMESSKSTDAMADEISANLQALVGTTEDIAPKAEPRHPINETTTSKFANLQFGRNYDHGTGRLG